MRTASCSSATAGRNGRSASTPTPSPPRRSPTTSGSTRTWRARWRCSSSARDGAHRPPTSPRRSTGCRRRSRRPSAVGDIQALRDRVAALTGTVEDLTAQRSEEHKAEVEQARADRVAIVEEIEALASRDPATVQWKATGQAVDALFARWQEAQKTGARLPKSEANDLWKRFRDARGTIDSQRRAYFAELDATQGAAREQKERIVARAEALNGSSSDAIGLRSLLDEWKLAGRAGKRVDDALWARFRAAGDGSTPPRRRCRPSRTPSTEATSRRSSRCSTEASRC